MSNTILGVTPRRPPMKPRMIRVSDEVWDRALAAADERGEILSEEIRKMIEQYVNRDQQ